MDTFFGLCNNPSLPALFQSQVNFTKTLEFRSALSPELPPSEVVTTVDLTGLWVTTAFPSTSLEMKNKVNKVRTELKSHKRGNTDGEGTFFRESIYGAIPGEEK